MAVIDSDLFNKALIRVLPYLKKEGLINYDSFADDHGLDKSVITHVVANRRKLPKHKTEQVYKSLVADYNVNPEFLKTNSGSFLKDPLPPNLNEVPQLMDLKNQVQDLTAENQLLRNQVSKLETLNAQQSQLIEALQNTSQKSAKKSAKK